MVVGYYGFANLGDEAILHALCEDLEAVGVRREEIVVLSQNPQQTELEHGVSALPRYNLQAIWRALGSARLLVSGGGSLLQDVTSKRSIPYYLGIVELARLRKVPTIMYGQGLGPVHSKFFQRWVKRAFQTSAGASVRDQDSLQFLLDLGLPQEKITLAADPVFQWESLPRGKPEQKILLNLRPYSLWEEQKSRWLEHLQLWQDRGYQLEFVPLGPGDLEIGSFLKSKFPHLKVHTDVRLRDLIEIFSGARLFISMRLHGLIFSVLHDCLPIGLNYDPKVVAICNQLKIPYWEIGNLPSLGKGVGEVLASEEQYQLAYQRARQALKKRALLNRQVLARVLR